jgi:hypothetical protein
MKKKLSDINFYEYEYERYHQARKTENLGKIMEEEANAPKKTDAEKRMERIMKDIQDSANANKVSTAMSSLANLKPGEKAYTDAIHSIYNLGLGDRKTHSSIVMRQNPKLRAEIINSMPTVSSEPETLEYKRALIKLHNQEIGYYKNKQTVPDTTPKTTQPDATTPPKSTSTSEKESPSDKGFKDATQGAKEGSAFKDATVNERFNEYLHMIKVSPTKALHYISEQKDLNEFVGFMETLTQKDIDEKVSSRQNYYLFKYNLAHKFGMKSFLDEGATSFDEELYNYGHRSKK